MYKKHIRELVSELNYYTKLYDEGHPAISDKEWDELYFKLQDMERAAGYYLPDSPTQKIKYEVVNELNKVKHNHPMLSLDKTKDWNEFLHYFGDKDVVGMLKLDGLTCSLRYVNGELVSAETRGDGEIGEDILHNAKVLPSIPNKIRYNDELILDGEIICTENDFAPFAKEYSNQRNFASGSIRLLDAQECAKRNLTFVVWNVVKGYDDEDFYFIDKMSKIELLGFNIVPWTTSFDYDAKDFLVDTAKQMGYPIDGLVGRYDDIAYGESLGTTGHHSKAAYAFKFYDEEYETYLKNIEWTMGRTGVLTPVAVFDPIDDGISIIERASIHNISIMDELSGGFEIAGDKLYIFKANQIIPQISRWEHSDDECNNGKGLLKIPDYCPICGKPTSIDVSESGTKNLVCDNPNCEGKMINKIDHFFGRKGLDAKGVSKKTIEKLMDWGWVSSIEDVFKLDAYKKQWILKEGFGEKSVNNFINSIKSASSNVPLWRVISAVGIPLVGNSVAKELEKEFLTWENFRKCSDYSYLDGVGEEINKAIMNYDFSKIDYIIDKYVIIKKENPKEKGNKDEGQSLADVTVVITGKTEIFKNREELKNKIELYGGSVSGSISKKTSVLINNDKNSTSSKNKKAKDLGIQILSEQEFIDLYLNN